MRLNIKITICLFSLMLGCSSPYNERQYIIRDLIQDVRSEKQKEPLPLAWGDSWIDRWNDLYSRLRRYRKNDAEMIIAEVEFERRRQGLPPINIKR